MIVPKKFRPVKTFRNQSIILFLTGALFLASQAGLSQTPVGGILNGNIIMQSNIRSVLLYKDGFEMGTPVMRLNSGEKLKLTFDDLDADLKSYKYTIVHCESDWSVSSDLQPRDYIDGYEEDNIDDFAYSFNTTVRYTHYSLAFPTQNLRPKISGNYLVRVYTEDPADPSFSWRFMVLETCPIGIEGQVHQANSISDRLSKQQIDFTIHFNGMQIDNPGRNLKIVITQNDRQDNPIRNIQPSFTKGESMEFTNNDAITFDAGNEFRSFDIKSLVYQTERIKTIRRDEKGFEVILLNDANRMLKNYSTEKEINGRMLIKSDDHARDSEVEADYAWVTFTLPYFPKLANGDVFLLGALTDWQLNESSKLNYDYEQKCYTGKLMLKQGHYDYLYLLVNSRTGHPEFSMTEGNHWETENEYTIWVYYRSGGDLYDRLLALQNLNMIR